MAGETACLATTSVFYLVEGLGDWGPSGQPLLPLHRAGCVTVEGKSGPDTKG